MKKSPRAEVPGAAAQKSVPGFAEVEGRKARKSQSAEYELGPALDFLQRIWKLDHALERLSSRMEKRLGITAQQRLIIRIVGQHPGIGSGSLASVLSVDPGTVSASLKRLEAKGLLERHRDPTDARRVALTLTAKGKTLERPRRGTVEEAVVRLLETKKPRDLASFTKTLERLTRELTQQLEE